MHFNAKGPHPIEKHQAIRRSAPPDGFVNGKPGPVFATLEKLRQVYVFNPKVDQEHRMLDARRRTRIQTKNREAILDAGLEVFSNHGFRGATLDQIADRAGLSKPNLLYYFASKEAIYVDRKSVV